MEPIRNLTYKDCTHGHDAAFTRIKKNGHHSTLLKYYNPEEELTIQCDASERGLGAAL